MRYTFRGVESKNCRVMVNVVSFIKRVKSEIEVWNDLTLYSMILMRYEGSYLCSDGEDGFVVCVDGMHYDINGVYYGKASRVKMSDDEVIDMFNDM